MAAKQEHSERDFYQEARKLVMHAKTATLATSHSGIPHAALVTLALTPELGPILLLSQLAIHTQQLLSNPACALLLTGEAGSPNPQTTKRLCLTGTAARTDDPLARPAFLTLHPYAAGYVDFTDFDFWRVSVTESYYIGGFAAAAKLEVSKLLTGL